MGLPTRIANCANGYCDVPHSFYFRRMNRFALSPESADLSSAIQSAPAWVRLGLAVPDARMRARAADELAKALVGHLCGTDSQDDVNQLPLAF